MIKPTDILAIYMEQSIQTDYGKMGFGILRYSKNKIACVIDSEFAGQTIKEVTEIDSDVEIVASIEEAQARNANVLILGTAPSGGRIPESWETPIINALNYGMSIVNGLHDYLGEKYKNHILNQNSQWIWDVRIPQFIPPIASAQASQLNNKRILLVGTDMAVGKITTGLELYRSLTHKGIKTGFVATGQIGITITGKGIPLDAFKVDLACGAVESAVMQEKDKDIIIIEGQGSLLHPGSTATLPLMRGSCPTHLILCMRGDLTTLRKPTHITIPNLEDFIRLNEDLCSVCNTYTRPRTIGISVNTSKMTLEAAKILIAKIEAETQISTTDIIRFGTDKLTQQLI